VPNAIVAVLIGSMVGLARAPGRFVMNDRALDTTVALDTMVARINIEHFCKRLSQQGDEAKRQTLLHLIEEEQTKLSALSHSTGL